ncbi:hypothetical protein A2125_00185 [Candidatus Woesebacteria bacterium GWB1_43_5]|uniref:Uncharacterized protein n=1 Tax=Candidatus Woesebacteria bacterium GWB1_43_5 TaxID=1802474 RepID=A0A1F7WU25_9BACT|nr:MAG: hypothetical protein A2125_00185 [Candidatus Woesebacteria bacterium GWB1_43_5]
MSDTKMLQAILNGQSAIREHVSQQILNVRKDIKKVEKKVDENTKRIDKLGSQLAYLEDDAPTGEEFRALSKRVEKVESKTALM